MATSFFFQPLIAYSGPGAKHIGSHSYQEPKFYYSKYFSWVSNCLDLQADWVTWPFSPDHRFSWIDAQMSLKPCKEKKSTTWDHTCHHWVFPCHLVIFSQWNADFSFILASFFKHNALSTGSLHWSSFRLSAFGCGCDPWLDHNKDCKKLVPIIYLLGTQYAGFIFWNLITNDSCCCPPLP